MTLVVDAAPLVALADRRDRMQAQVAALLHDSPANWWSPRRSRPRSTICSAGTSVTARAAPSSRISPSGRFTVACLDRDDHEIVVELERRYAEHDMGLADLSVVVVAHRVGTRRIATFDERHFRTLRPLDGGHFSVLPLTVEAGRPAEPRTFHGGPRWGSSVSGGTSCRSPSLPITVQP